MTTLVIVAVRDSAAGGFGRPVFSASTGVAARSFSDEVNRVADDNQMNKHPGDFELWKIGEYDDVSGVVTSCEHLFLARGKDVILSS